jgi:hypothetical protein
MGFFSQGLTGVWWQGEETFEQHYQLHQVIAHLISFLFNHLLYTAGFHYTLGYTNIVL